MLQKLVHWCSLSDFLTPTLLFLFLTWNLSYCKTNNIKMSCWKLLRNPLHGFKNTDVNTTQMNSCEVFWVAFITGFVWPHHALEEQVILSKIMDPQCRCLWWMSVAVTAAQFLFGIYLWWWVWLWEQTWCQSWLEVCSRSHKSSKKCRSG